MRTFSRGLFGFLAGGYQPRDVAGAVFLGLMMGFLAGFHYAAAALLLAALLLNIHGRTLLASLVAGWTAGQFLEPFNRQLGRSLLESPLGRELIAMLGDGPAATLAGMNDYAAVGALVIALAIAAPLSLAAASMTRKLRSSLTADGPSGRGPIAEALGGLMFGGPGERRLALLTAPPRIFRACGWIAAMAITPLALSAPWSIHAQAARQTLLAELSAANGGEVTAGALELSLWTGRFAIEDLRFADPADPRGDRLRVLRVAGHVSPSGLLCGRLEADDLQIEGIRTGVARQRVTQLIEQPFEPPTGNVASSYGQEAGATGTEGVTIAMHENVRGWEQLGPRLDHVSQFVSYLGQLQRVQAATHVERPNAASATRYDPSRHLPRITLRDVRIEQLPRWWNLGPKTLIEIDQLTSDAVALGRPTVVRAVLPEWSAEWTLTLNLHEPGQRQDVSLAAYGLPLEWLVDLGRYGPRVEIDEGQVDVVGQGWADAQQLNLALTIDAKQLRLEVQDERPVAGIPPTLFNQVVARLGRLQVPANLLGSWDRPRLEMDRTALLRALRRQLRTAGDEQLTAAIEQAEVDPARDAGPVAQRSAPQRSARQRSAPQHHMASNNWRQAGLSGEPRQSPPVVDSAAYATTAPRSRSNAIEPGVYPQTATPDEWAPQPSVVSAAAAEADMQRPGDDSVVDEASRQPRFVGEYPPENNPPAPPEIDTVMPSADAAGPIPPGPVDLALGYDAEPFNYFDLQEVERATPAEMLWQEDVEAPVSPNEPAEPSRLERLSTHAQQMISRAWPFSRSSEPGPDPFIAERLPADDAAEFEAWETTYPPLDVDQSAAAEPWYQRIWR